MTRRARSICTAFGRSERGAAAAEIALWLSALIIPLLNVIDLGLYVYQRMQVEVAAEAAVNAAWHDCNASPQAIGATASPPPLLTTCKAAVSTVFTDMQTAAQSTSLGTGVTLPLANIVEGYYCATSTGALTQMGSTYNASSPPTSIPSQTCTGTTTLAGDYIQATTNFTYTPLFTGMSIVTVLGTSVTKTAWLRLDK